MVLKTVLAWVAFAVLHSFTVSEPYDRLLRGVVGDARHQRWHRLGYNLLSAGTFILLLAYLGSLADTPLYALSGPAHWCFRAVQCVGLIILFRTPLRVSEFLGLQQAMASGTPMDSTSPPRLCTGKTYSFVRHPLYLGCSILVLFQPVQTTVSFVSAVMVVLYFWVGTFHEEARMIRSFGDAYLDYQRKVPRLIPFPKLRIWDSSIG